MIKLNDFLPELDVINDPALRALIRVDMMKEVYVCAHRYRLNRRLIESK